MLINLTGLCASCGSMPVANCFHPALGLVSFAGIFTSTPCVCGRTCLRLFILWCRIVNKYICSCAHEDANKQRHPATYIHTHPAFPMLIFHSSLLDCWEIMWIDGRSITGYVNNRFSLITERRRVRRRLKRRKWFEGQKGKRDLNTDPA